MQRGVEVTPDWCDLSQMHELCKGCTYDKGRSRSRWQGMSADEREKATQNST